MRIHVTENDANGFLEQIEMCVNGIAQLVAPQEVVLVRTNNWFGPKWLPFSAPTRTPDSGIAPNNLSLPLFVPNRVVAQCNFAAPLYEEVAAESIHCSVRTSHARQRLVSDLNPGLALFWYSGNSKSTGRGSMLSYVPVERRYHPWYAGWAGNDDWQIALVKGIGLESVLRFIDAGSSPIVRGEGS
jgi:hypothetical protein